MGESQGQTIILHVEVFNDPTKGQTTNIWRLMKCGTEIYGRNWRND